MRARTETVDRELRVVLDGRLAPGVTRMGLFEVKVSHFRNALIFGAVLHTGLPRLLNDVYLALMRYVFV